MDGTPQPCGQEHQRHVHEGHDADHRTQVRLALAGHVHLAQDEVARIEEPENHRRGQARVPRPPDAPRMARPDGAGNERQPAEHHAHFGGGPGHGVPVAVARLEVGHPGHADEEEAHEGPPRQRQVRVENLLHQSHRLLDRRIPIDKHLTGRHEHAAEHGAGEHPCVSHEIIRLLKRQRGRGQARRQGTRRQRPRRCRAMIPRLRAALR